VCEPGVVSITDGQALKAGGADASRELIGSVVMTNGRELHVRRWPTAVSVPDQATGHSGWALRMVDQVEALRDAIERASSSAVAV
jgi:hypothetical protein